MLITISIIMPVQTSGTISCLNKYLMQGKPSRHLWRLLAAIAHSSLHKRMVSSVSSLLAQAKCGRLCTFRQNASLVIPLASCTFKSWPLYNLENSKWNIKEKHIQCTSMSFSKKLAVFQHLT